MKRVDAKSLVDAWATPWPAGASAAVVSAIDVLVCDVLEEETGVRPDGVVTLEGIDGDALASWTLGWPSSAGFLERLLHRKQAKLLARLAEDDAVALARITAWKRVYTELGEIPWATIADMEVVSLAMGHYGPARQPVALAVIAPFLVAVAAAFAGASVDRIALAVPAARNVLRYEPAFAEIARTSARAIEELARRATERGQVVGDPFARPITAYLPMLGGTLV